MTTEKGNNILISNFDRFYEYGRSFLAAVYVSERYNYSRCGEYFETIIVEGNREKLRDGVKRALEYARENNLPVQINNRMVMEDIENGILDITGITIMEH
jgi:hypothetical protein